MQHVVKVYKCLVFKINSPELWDSEGRVLLRLGALLRRDTFLGLGGTVGGLGWWGGVKHLIGLWGPWGVSGLVTRDSSETGSALDVTVLPFICRSATEKNNVRITRHKNLNFLHMQNIT